MKSSCCGVWVIDFGTDREPYYGCTKCFRSPCEVTEEPMSIDTPRTDAKEFIILDKYGTPKRVVYSAIAKDMERELADAHMYDKRVCTALGMTTVDPEEALNVIDGLRFSLSAALRMKNSPFLIYR